MTETIISKAGELKDLAEKAYRGERLTIDEGVALFSADLPLLAALALSRKRKASGDTVFFNRNFHVEPTNICLLQCDFCSYWRSREHEEAWDYDFDAIADICRRYVGTGVTEVHIVGGVHPDRDAHHYGEMLRTVKSILPSVHVKGFTAIELDYMIRKAGFSVERGLEFLKSCGLDSIPGGGAEIFDEEVRGKICRNKTSSKLWLSIHEAAHRAGIPSNASMLYGHVETVRHRIEHLDRLRRLQDETGGFNAFIPLKYKSANNAMSVIGEVSDMDVMKTFALSRIYLDNIPHVKAYWPMLGRDTAQLALHFGADDMDGTINDTTKIYSMAGSEEFSPAMTTAEMLALIAETGFEAAERDSLYNVLS